MKELKYAFDYLCLIKSRIAASRRFFLFLDYDGTITPIVKNPGDAKPPQVFLEMLKTLQYKEKTVLSIVSGREIKSLESFFKGLDISVINLAGSHGSEFLLAGHKNQGRFFHTFTAKDLETISYLKDKIKPEALEIPGAKLELKPYSFAVHYRNVPDKHISGIDKIIEILKKEKEKRVFKYMLMKKVIEVMPKKQQKGNALKKILEHYDENPPIQDNGKKSVNKPDYFIICIGDDITDEELFRANKNGANIRVQKEPFLTDTLAEYYLKDPAEVISFLEKIL